MKKLKQLDKKQKLEIKGKVILTTLAIGATTYTLTFMGYCFLVKKILLEPFEK